MPIVTATAQDIIDLAPLGAIVRFSDGTPQPPARFKRKRSAWEDRNGTGRLTGKCSAREGRTGDFTLRLGDWGTNDVIILSINRVYSADSRGSFIVEQQPQPGQALVLNCSLGRDELVHIAANVAEAQTWLQAHGYPNARIEIVVDREGMADAA